MADADRTRAALSVGGAGEARPLFLVGFMGAGKTTVGRIVAERLGRPFLDLDDEIEARAGTTIESIFAASGEAGFRVAEREALEHVSSVPGVVCACGGGVVTDEASRSLLASRGDVVHLVVGAADAVERTGSDGRVRPLMRGLQSAERLLLERTRLYEEAATLTVQTARRTPEQVADEIVAWVGPVGGTLPQRIVVGHRDGSYTIEVGGGALGRLGAVVREALGDRVPAGCALVTDDVVGPLFASRAVASLAGAGLACSIVTVPAGERSKSWEEAGWVLEAFSEAGLGRDGVVVALGGGVVGDLAGFAAAAYLRGVPVVQVPTTLLGMVDSAIGGKTGVDLPRGKNLAGAFWPPAAVLIDPTLLATLAKGEWRSGFGEVVKSAILAGESAVSLMERDAAALVAREPAAVGRAVLMSVRLKAGVVEGDELESGAREALNYGHTLAHALERELGYGALAHGVAVADGIRFAARLGVTIGLTPPQWAERQERLLDAFGLLPIDAACEPGALLAAMHADKKARVGQVRMVFSTGPGQWEARVVDDEALLAALGMWCGGAPARTEGSYR